MAQVQQVIKDRPTYLPFFAGNESREMIGNKEQKAHRISKTYSGAGSGANQVDGDYQSVTGIQLIQQQPVRDLENYFGRQSRSKDKQQYNSDLGESTITRRSRFSHSKELPNFEQRIKYNTSDQFISMPTRTSRVCMNAQMEKTPAFGYAFDTFKLSPYYEPTACDTDNDPRYHSQSTKTFTTDYKRQKDFKSTKGTLTVRPSYLRDEFGKKVLI